MKYTGDYYSILSTVLYFGKNKKVKKKIQYNVSFLR